MKKSRGLTVVGTSLLLAAANSHAQSADKLYLGADVGAAIPHSATIQSAPYTGEGIKFDTGLRAGVKLGYDLPRSFAVELDTGVIWNQVHSLAGTGANADLYQFPLLVNGVYKVPLKGAFKPYVGAGIGAAVGMFDGSNIPGLYYPVPGANTSYSSTDVALAYQAEAGFQYSVTKNVDLGVAYQFLETTGYRWFDNNTAFKIDGTMTHAVFATLTWRF